MKSTKLNKILITVLCFAMVATMSATALATTIGNVEIDPTTPTDQTYVTVGNKIIGIIKVVGIVISVATLMILGIKYMMGSAEEKAEYKKTFIPYIVGAVLLFGASAFANSIYNLASGLRNSRIIFIKRKRTLLKTGFFFVL